MYLGRIVEQGDARDVIERPGHPYTQALVDGRCRRASSARALGGELPDAAERPGRLPLPPALPEALRALRPGRPVDSTRPASRAHEAACLLLGLRDWTCYLFPGLPTDLVGYVPSRTLSGALPQ